MPMRSRAASRMARETGPNGSCPPSAVRARHVNDMVLAAISAAL